MFSDKTVYRIQSTPPTISCRIFANLFATSSRLAMQHYTLLFPPLFTVFLWYYFFNLLFRRFFLHCFFGCCLFRYYFLGCCFFRCCFFSCRLLRCCFFSCCLLGCCFFGCCLFYYVLFC